MTGWRLFCTAESPVLLDGTTDTVPTMPAQPPFTIVTRTVPANRRTRRTSKTSTGVREVTADPRWTETGGLMPTQPNPKATPYRWDGATLYDLTATSGGLVPVGRGGERRVIAIANPGLGGRPYATPTLWAAIHYLNPGWSRRHLRRPSVSKRRSCWATAA